MFEPDPGVPVWVCWTQFRVWPVQRAGCMDNGGRNRRGHKNCGWYTVDKEKLEDE